MASWSRRWAGRRSRPKSGGRSSDAGTLGAIRVGRAPGDGSQPRVQIRILGGEPERGAIDSVPGSHGDLHEVLPRLGEGRRAERARGAGKVPLPSQRMFDAMLPLTSGISTHTPAVTAQPLVRIRGDPSCGERSQKNRPARPLRAGHCPTCSSAGALHRHVLLRRIA